MKSKINEDWLSVIIAFILIALTRVGVLSPGWVRF